MHDCPPIPLLAILQDCWHCPALSGVAQDSPPTSYRPDWADHRSSSHISAAAAASRLAVGQLPAPGPPCPVMATALLWPSHLPAPIPLFVLHL